MKWKPRTRTLRTLARLVSCCATLVVLACGDTPSTPSNSEDIVFLGSTPAQGGSIGQSGQRNVFSFEVKSGALNRFTALYVKLLDVAGRTCGGASKSIPRQDPSLAARVEVPVFTGGGGCPYPSLTPDVEIRTLSVSLHLLGPDEVILLRSFPVRYTLSGPALSAQHTEPEIASLDWHVVVSTGFPETQAPGRRNRFFCGARDADGGPLTITMTLATPDCLTPNHCWSETKTFARRLIDTPVLYDAYHPAPNTITTGTLTCAVTQWGGATARRSVCYTTSRQAGCP